MSRSSPRFPPRALLALALLVWIPAAGHASAAREGRIVRVAEPPEIDGRLDDAIWQGIAPIGELAQSEPVEGAVPTERTEIRVAFDADQLYVAVRMFDSDPSGLVAKQMVLDADMTSDDRINLVLDTFHDNRNAYFFQINPAGTRSDALIENNRRFRRDWNGIWYARASVDAEGWSAEFAIPFKTVSLSASSGRWGFEAERIIRRKNEKLRWGNASQNRRITDVAGIGVLTGLEDIDATGIDVKPNFSLGRRSGLREGGVPGDPTVSSEIVEPAGDLFYKFHPAMVATFTGNTNFLETPLDDLRTELTRFPPVRPEQRDFFLQDAGIFEFGGLTGNGIPYFSRRIGRLNGQPLSMDAGLKLTGRAGGLSFGGLGVTLPPQRGVDRTNLVVGRVQYDVLGESAVGLLGTWGDPTGQTDNALIGADFEFFESDFRDGQILRGNAYFMKTFSDVGGDQDLAYGARLEYPNDRWNASAGYQHVGADFDPRLGFANRRDIHRYDGLLRRRWRPGGYLRTVDTQIEGSAVTDGDHAFESAEIKWTLTELQNQSGDKLRFQYSFRDERLVDQGFEIDPGVVIPIGEYRFHRYGVRLETANYRPVAVIGELIWGDFFDGRLLQMIGTLNLRPARYLFVGLEYEQDEGELPAGDFTKRLARARVNLAFTPQISWTNTLQYERSSRVMDLSSIFRWEIEPGSDLYLIVKQTFVERVPGDFVATDGIQAVKLAWTFRF